MLLKDLKENMILPQKEIPINKTASIRGSDVHLMSITLENQKAILWAAYLLPCQMGDNMDFDEATEFFSNREKMTSGISKKTHSSHIHISELTVQNHKITFSSSSASHIHQMNFEGYMQLQHFVENKMFPANWDEVKLDNIIIADYKQRDGETFPPISNISDSNITLNISQSFEEISVGMPITFTFGGSEKNSRYHFYDPAENKNRVFYINNMYLYDIWKETDSMFDSNEDIKNFSKEQIEEIKEQYFSCLESICPKGMDLAIIEYETEDDIQLNFYSKKYLDEKPKQASSSSCGLLLSPDSEFGSNGFKNRVCIIEPVEKDFNGNIDIELLSWHRVLPEETVEI